MVFETYKRYDSSARFLASEQSFEDAAHAFTAAAHLMFGDSNYASRPVEDGQVALARGLRSLLSATLCYRMASKDDRAQHRAAQGISIAEEIRDHVANADPQRGFMDEFTGDLQVVSGISGWEDSYESAYEYYHDCDNVMGWVAEPEFELNTSFLFETAGAADYSIDHETKAELNARSLRARIEYKREHFTSIVEQVESTGSWP